jgi:hypothetical protein
MSFMEKLKLITAWKTHLEEALERANTSQAEARQGMRVDGDNRPANRGERATVTSQGYLTQGLSKRIDTLEEALDLLERVGTGLRDQVVMGALVKAKSEKGELLWFALLPGGDASTVTIDDVNVLVLSPQAPFVQPFIGLREGDEVEITLIGRSGQWELLGIA